MEQEELKMAPYKLVMLLIVVAVEVPAIIILAVGWVKARKEERQREKEE